MTNLTLSAAARRTSKIVVLLALTLAVSGCGCGLLSKDAWSGGGNCARLQREEQDTREQQTQRELPALKKRADDGDVKAQVAMGEFHLSPQHPNAVRATGLAYYEKAARQGNLPAQYVLVTETHKDCHSKARKLGQKEADGPQFAPHCAAEWLAFEKLATQSCARGARNLNCAVQVSLTSLLALHFIKWVSSILNKGGTSLGNFPSVFPISFFPTRYRVQVELQEYAFSATR